MGMHHDRRVDEEIEANRAEETPKPKVWKKQFKTRLEAKRFSEGVNFVNDSALLVVIVKNKGRNKGYRVEITDTDFNEDD